MSELPRCPVCAEAVTPQRAEDAKQVIVTAGPTRLAHWSCARALPLCPIHRQRFLSDRCARCAAETDRGEGP
jgi:hypothetical protein